MKVFVQDGIVIAHAETEPEIKSLLRLKDSNPSGDGRGRYLRTDEHKAAISSSVSKALKRKYVSRKHRKECDICGKLCKKVNLHKTLMHGTTPVKSGHAFGRWRNHKNNTPLIPTI